MVAAAKLRRAQDAVLKTRPYAHAPRQGARPRRRPRRRRGVGHRPPAAGRARGPPGRGGGHHLRPRPGRRLQLQHHPPRAALHHRERRHATSGSSSRTIGRKAKDFLRARKLAVRKDCVGVHQGLSYAKAEAIAQELREALPGRRGRRGLPLLQRVQERHRPGPGGGAAPARSSRRPSRPRPASTSSTSPPATPCWRSSSRATSPCRSGGRSSRSAASEHGARMTRHGVGHQERRGDDRGAHPAVQPRAPGLRSPRSSWRSWAAPRRSSSH